MPSVWLRLDSGWQLVAAGLSDADPEDIGDTSDAGDSTSASPSNHVHAGVSAPSNNGSDGQLLHRTSSGTEWADVTSDNIIDAVNFAANLDDIASWGSTNAWQNPVSGMADNTRHNNGGFTIEQDNSRDVLVVPSTGTLYLHGEITWDGSTNANQRTKIRLRVVVERGGSDIVLDGRSSTGYSRGQYDGFEESSTVITSQFEVQSGDRIRIEGLITAQNAVFSLIDINGSSSSFGVFYIGGGNTEGGGLGEGAVDTRVTTLVSDWAEDGNTDDIPDSKIPDSIARDTEIPSNSDIDDRIADWAQDGDTSNIPDSKIPSGIARDSEVPSNSDIDNRIESWAQEGNTDDIPASKIPDVNVDVSLNAINVLSVDVGGNDDDIDLSVLREFKGTDLTASTDFISGDYTIVGSSAYMCISNTTLANPSSSVPSSSSFIDISGSASGLPSFDFSQRRQILIAPSGASSSEWVDFFIDTPNDNDRGRYLQIRSGSNTADWVELEAGDAIDSITLPNNSTSLRLSTLDTASQTGSVALRPLNDIFTLERLADVDNFDSSDAGRVLQVNSAGDGTEWSEDSGGGADLNDSDSVIVSVTGDDNDAGDSEDAARADHRHDINSSSHSHTISDSDIPSSITRDSEVANAFNSVAFSNSSRDISFGRIGVSGTSSVGLDILREFKGHNLTTLTVFGRGDYTSVGDDFYMCTGESVAFSNPSISVPTHDDFFILNSSVSFGTDTATLGADSKDDGDSETVSHSDHRHNINYGETSDIQNVGATNSAGNIDEIARADHVHNGSVFGLIGTSNYSVTTTGNLISGTNDISLNNLPADAILGVSIFDSDPEIGAGGPSGIYTPLIPIAYSALSSVTPVTSNTGINNNPHNFAQIYLYTMNDNERIVYLGRDTSNNLLASTSFSNIDPMPLYLFRLA